MIKNKLTSVQGIAFVLLFSVFNFFAFSQTSGKLSAVTLLPNGLPSHGAVLGNPLSDNILFGYSDYSITNVLVLNGISVPLQWSGWYTNDGNHNVSNSNYVCGEYSGTIYRNFFAIDLSNLSSYGITLPITSAALYLERYTSLPITGTIMYQFHSMTTPWDLINQNYDPGSVPGQTIFSDLGKGTSLGYVSVDRAASGPVVVMLNNEGLNAINSAIGTTVVLGGSTDFYAVPVPVWVIIVGFFLIALFLVLRFRKRQLA